MSLLSQLLESEPEPDTPATVATVATLGAIQAKESQESQESQGGSAEKRTHARLLALAEREGLDAAQAHELTGADLQGCMGLSDAQLCAYLYLLADTAERNAGRRPASYTARALCRGCGPVWLPPAHVAKAPTVGGWPRVLGCPWCVVRGAGKHVPRPPVTSATCKHWMPDGVNPDGGMGRCKCGYHYPNARHACADYHPRGTS